VNLEKLDEAIAHIEARPEQHKQSYWFTKTDGGCGTAYCLAGALALLAGWKPVWGGGEVDGHDEASVAVKDDRVEDVQLLALQILQPTGHELRIVHSMFASGNTLADIKEYRDQIAVGEL
jgi:hypothetical protein